MIEIGNMVIRLSPFTIVALASIFAALFGLGIRFIFAKLRTRGARLAMIAARRDFPDEKVISSAVLIENGKRYAMLQLSNGKSVKYLIVAADELAIRVRDA